MTLDELRLEVAKVLGWKDVREEEHPFGIGPPSMDWWGTEPGCPLRTTLPDWPRDDRAAVELLNVMAKRGLKPLLQNTERFNKPRTRYWWRCEVQTETKVIYGGGPTIAEAVARAFIEAAKHDPSPPAAQPPVSST